MSTIRKHGEKWQSIIRLSGHPNLSKTFVKFSDAKRWSLETELKIRREDAGIVKIKYPKFSEIALKYINEVSITKRCFKDERYTINSLMREAWSEYPINRVTANIIGAYRDRQLKNVTGSTVNRRLDVVSTIFTQCKKEWGYPVPNPVLSIRRPKKAEPRNRRFTDAELNLLIKGNKTNEVMRTLIQIALATGMRKSECIGILPEHLMGNTLFIPVAKTKPRTIPLTKKAVELIKAANLPFKVSADYVNKQFAKLCKHYKIKDAKFHDIRHQSLSDLMVENKLSVGETMIISGHSDPRMLLRVYNNLKVEDISKKLENIS
jgi:integrase